MDFILFWNRYLYFLQGKEQTICVDQQFKLKGPLIENEIIFDGTYTFLKKYLYFLQGKELLKVYIKLQSLQSCKVVNSNKTVAVQLLILYDGLSLVPKVECKWAELPM